MSKDKSYRGINVTFCYTANKLESEKNISRHGRFMEKAEKKKIGKKKMTYFMKKCPN